MNAHKVVRKILRKSRIKAFCSIGLLIMTFANISKSQINPNDWREIQFGLDINNCDNDYIRRTNRLNEINIQMIASPQSEIPMDLYSEDLRDPEGKYYQCLQTAWDRYLR
jgi:hypothetical protein